MVQIITHSTIIIIACKFYILPKFDASKIISDLAKNKV